MYLVVRMKSSFCLFFLHYDCEASVGSRRNVGEEAHCVQHRVRELDRECHILPDQVRERLATLVPGLSMSGISCMLSRYPAGTQGVLRGYSEVTQRVLRGYSEDILWVAWRISKYMFVIVCAHCAHLSLACEPIPISANTRHTPEQSSSNHFRCPARHATPPSVTLVVIGVAASRLSPGRR